MPADANLRESLTLLRSSGSKVLSGMLCDSVTLWLGSGISRKKFPDLNALLFKLLVKIQEKIDQTNSGCPYKSAWDRIFKFTALEIKGASHAVHPSLWATDDLKGVLKQLVPSYADVLEQHVRIVSGNLCWDILELDKLYGDPTVTPDAEHVFLALLIHEGIVTELVTTNWDALIEAAYQQSKGAGGVQLQVIARNDEWQRQAGSSRLIKMHGCAQKALSDPAAYRSFLVATHSHILQWKNDPSFEPFRTEFKAIMRQRAAFFIGLSVQDWNLQAECFSASGTQRFSPSSPKVFFAEPTIQPSQQTVLRAIYGPDAYEAGAETIDAQATVPLYAKALLGGVFILVLFAKLEAIFESRQSELSPGQASVVKLALQELETLLVSKYDAFADSETRWRAFAREVPSFIGRLLLVFRHQKAPGSVEAYEPITTLNLHQMKTGFSSDPSSFWLLVALAMLLEGKKQSFWTLLLPGGAEGKYGQVSVKVPAGSTNVFLIQRDNALVKLEQSGCVDLLAPKGFIVIYPEERPRTKKRTASPQMQLGTRRTSNQLHELWLRQLVEETQTIDELLRELHSALSLAAI
ncbi:MAG: hypothetical protein JWM16_5903 [Verrucomicrobiales bacterium]|nr:hypothetical protein [Verrucomicrobiales bacterium]